MEMFVYESLDSFLFEKVKIYEVTDKDWQRMLDLFLSGKDGENVAYTIKDKYKAVARYVAGLYLSGNEKNFPYEDKFAWRFGQFRVFAEVALKLGATIEDIKDLIEKTQLPAKYSEKLKNLNNKHLKDRFVGELIKKILDQGHEVDVKYSGDAITWPGKDAMRRNGRKWTIGYRILIDNNYLLEFDAITDEGDGPTYYYSDKLLAAYSWNPVGKREFFKTVLDKVNNL